MSGPCVVYPELIILLIGSSFIGIFSAAAAFAGAAAVLSLAAAAAAAAISFCLGLGGGFGGCFGIIFGSTTVSDPLDSVVVSPFLGTCRTWVVILASSSGCLV